VTGSSAVPDGQSHFWEFSLTVYGAPGVQEECLHLQERYGVDVNVLLFCAYVGAVHGARLQESDVRAAAAALGDWNQTVVSNLRVARRALKPFATGASASGAAAEALRNLVKTAELEAERIEQKTLEVWSAAHIGTWQRAEPVEAVAANIAVLLATHDMEVGEPGLTSHLVAATFADGRPTRT